ncbi:hypothetical protein [Massilia phosphatilytica]
MRRPSGFGQGAGERLGRREPVAFPEQQAGTMALVVKTAVAAGVLEKNGRPSFRESHGRRHTSGARCDARGMQEPQYATISGMNGRPSSFPILIQCLENFTRTFDSHEPRSRRAPGFTLHVDLSIRVSGLTRPMSGWGRQGAR